jgi:DNA-binding transcriptional regulator YhcF (GntR family)
MINRIFQIDEVLAIPKYRQIIDSIYNSLEAGLLKQGDKLPSINKICAKFGLSRDTVLMAFNELKSKGVISSVSGKGYYIERTNEFLDQKIFLLFDELNAFKEDLYSSFMNHLDAKVVVDIYFHHFNYKVFKDLITESSGKYTSYIIMPATFDYSNEIISILPQDKVYILDRLKPDLVKYPVIYQDFEADVYERMIEGRESLAKYEKYIMVFPGGKEPIERTQGFERFCKKFNISFEIIKSLENRKIHKGEVYFVVTDRNLVTLIKMANKGSLKIGSDLGIVSFNDTVLKEVVSDGITTISTDFFNMGQRLAQMVQNKEKVQLRNPSYLIRRKSL